MSKSKTNEPVRFLSILLIAVGCLQITGYFFKSRGLRGLGFAYGASPLATVFGTVSGVEGFSTQHKLRFINKYGDMDSIFLDQQLFNQFKGSYFLKNSYSVLLAYPHMLKPELVSQATDFLLCKENLRKQFGLNDSITKPSIQTWRNFYGKPEVITLNPFCKQ